MEMIHTATGAPIPDLVLVVVLDERTGKVIANLGSDGGGEPQALVLAGPLPGRLRSEGRSSREKRLRSHARASFVRVAKLISHSILYGRF